MKFVLPMAFSDPTHGCEMARVAESTGWHAATVSDHVVHPETIRSPYPYTADGTPRFGAETPWPDPWVLIAAMAAVTSRLRFLTNVYVLPLRNPFVVAKAVGTAAVLSGDRVALGIGMGWMEEEFDLLEQPFRRRGRRADEMIAVMRKLWTGEPVEHHGEFYDFAPVRMLPAPRERIPVYIGGTSEAAFERVARLGDGWVSDLHTTSDLARLIAHIKQLRDERGRGDQPLEVIASATDAFDVDGYRRLEDAGVTQIMTLPWLFYGGSTGSLAEKKEGIARFAEDVISRMPREPSG